MNFPFIIRKITEMDYSMFDEKNKRKFVGGIYI